MQKNMHVLNSPACGIWQEPRYMANMALAKMSKNNVIIV